MPDTKLNQIVAIESGVKTRVNAYVTQLYKTLQHPQLFEGFSKTYRPIGEDGEQFPPEQKVVQHTAMGLLTQAASAMSELFDVTFAKDVGNTQARASVVVDGKVLLPDVPVPYLLFLEKQLTDVHTMVAKMPVLDPAESWSTDENTGLFRTNPTATVKTKKVQRALVLYPHSAEHPAQTQLITEDVTVGNWQQTKFSGAITGPAQQRLLQRIEILQKAVKFAREEANAASVPMQPVGERVFSWLFAK